MSEKSKSQLSLLVVLWGRSLFFSTFFFFITLTSLNAQNYNYWQNAPIGATKIYSISFIDSQNGKAESGEGDILITIDGGNSWSVKNFTSVIEKPASQILWGADIYCSIMRTTDGGATWLPYDEKKQDHFCGVYLKDENTNYKVASNFLNKVTNEIKSYSENNKIDSLLNHPKKCTEYYRNPTEGWAVGWCIKNFIKSSK